MTETVLRTARFEDCQEGTALLRRLGLDLLPEDRAAIERYWDRLWRSNPAHDGGRPMPLPGWVLENGGRIVGFFGNYAGEYRLGGRHIAVGLTTHWGVDQAFRSETRRLAEAYFNQPQADLILVTTANAAAGRHFLRHGSIPMPQPGLDRAAFWVLDAGGFLVAAARKKGFPVPALARLAAPPLAAIAAVRRAPPSPPGEIAVSSGIDSFDERMDDLWRAKAAESPPRLLACRDARSLRWHFAPYAARGELRVLMATAGGRLAGYAVVVPAPADVIGLKRARVADLLARDDDPTVVRALLAKAIAVARADEMHVIEAGAVPARLRPAVESLRPFYRTLPTRPYYWKAMDPSLVTVLADPSAWYITAYDGDAALF